MRKSPRSIVLMLAFVLLTAPAKAVNLTELSIEELMSIKIPAMMTTTSSGMIPASVTTITEEDIRLTPARNIYDLLEVYVPGALWTYHNESQHLSLRGLSSDRETKILLLVNGFNINQVAYAGAVDELINWDLNDIREIQVIRGPGSVTYGPGAIEAVINIVTHDAESAPGVSMGAKYVAPYRSKGGYVSVSKLNPKYKAYLYGTGTWTQGTLVDTFDVDTNGSYGYIGMDGFQNYRTSPNWYHDFRDRPQYKFHTQIDFAKEWRFWARYNQAGYTHEPAVANSKLASTDVLYNYERQILNRYAVLVLENHHLFTDWLTLKSEIGFHTYDRIKDESTPKIAIRDHVRNRNPVFGSHRFLTKVVANITLTKKIELAVGGSHVNEFVGPGWNRLPQDMYIYGIVSDSATNAASYKYTVGKGWYAQTLSGMAEANLKLEKRFNLILSGRADRHEYTKNLFSPRAAVLSDWGRFGVTKVIAQQAQRMNDSSELWIAHQAGLKPPPENLRGLEVIWNNPSDQLVDVMLSGYYSKTSILGFNQATLNVSTLGNLDTAGVELEVKRQASRYTVGANHSYGDLVDFHLGPGVNIAAISYSDAKTVTGGGTLAVSGTGDNINNWANHSTKVFARYRPIKDRLTLHGDVRVFWAFEGKKDSLVMFDNGTGLNATQLAFQDAHLAFLRAKDVGGLDYRVDASAEIKITDPMSVIVWGQNIIGAWNYRYGYDGGANNVYPTRFETTIEPAAVGVRMDWKL